MDKVTFLVSTNMLNILLEVYEQLWKNYIIEISFKNFFLEFEMPSVMCLELHLKQYKYIKK